MVKTDAKNVLFICFSLQRGAGVGSRAGGGAGGGAGVVLVYIGVDFSL